jgi:hypothetical protein
MNDEILPPKIQNLQETHSCRRITLAKLRPDRVIKSILWKTVHFARKYKYRERKTSYGNENSDKIFYIIGFFDYACGLFGLISHVLKHIVYAEKFEYIPIVDFQNYDTQYLDPGSLCKKMHGNIFSNSLVGIL